MGVDIYMRRRAVNVVAMLLSGLAAALGLMFLVWILWITVKNGLGALDFKLFTKITAYADQGGLANAIVGSLVMDLIALAICFGWNAMLWLLRQQSASRRDEIA